MKSIELDRNQWKIIGPGSARLRNLRQYASRMETADERAYSGSLFWQWTSNTQEEKTRQVRRDNERVRQERDILKKALIIFSKPKQ